MSDIPWAEKEAMAEMPVMLAMLPVAQLQAARQSAGPIHQQAALPLVVQISPPIVPQEALRRAERQRVDLEAKAVPVAQGEMLMVASRLALELALLWEWEQQLI
jgi:hypothetical protein